MSILQHASFNAYLWWSAALLQNLVHGEPKLEICLDNQYVHVFSWLASHTVCSFAQEHSEMRQLRHQNHHFKQQLEQQLEQHRDSMVKMQDTMDVMAFQMNQMGTVYRGQLGCTMALLQQTAQGSKLGGGSTAQHVQAIDTSSDESLTAAARQRRKAEKRSHEMLMAAKQKEVRLQDSQMQATHPEGPSSGSGGAADQSDLQAPPGSPPAQQPSVSQEDIGTLPEQAAEHSQSARAGAPDQGAGAGTSRLSNLPIDMYPESVKELKVPGRDQPVWTTWLGQYLTLNSKKHWLCYIFLGFKC